MTTRFLLILLATTACSTSGDDGSTTTPDASSSTVDCASATTTIDKAVCQANGFLAGLSTTELATANLSLSDTASRTKWSNLPTGLVTRAGVQLGALSAANQANALALMSVVLSDTSDLVGVRAADDYLAANGGGTSYGAGLYYVAIFGTPSATGDWAIMFGGHHMAYNLMFSGGVGYPTPNHLGVEPKAAFTLDGQSYAPLAGEGNAMVAIFNQLSTADLSTAHLSGTFSDVVVGPVEYATGSSAAAKAKFPTGANRTGVLVSSLSATQQALVTAAIGAWVSDFDSSISSSLLADYTSSDAYADTYVAWGGTASAPDVDVSGTYMRIDGPRAWIEVACQSGIVIRDLTHYHTIYRDKTLDYGNSL